MNLVYALGPGHIDRVARDSMLVHYDVGVFVMVVRIVPLVEPGDLVEQGDILGEMLADPRYMP